MTDRNKKRNITDAVKKKRKSTVVSEEDKILTLPDTDNKVLKTEGENIVEQLDLKDGEGDIVKDQKDFDTSKSVSESSKGNKSKSDNEALIETDSTVVKIKKAKKTRTKSIGAKIAARVKSKTVPTAEKETVMPQSTTLDVLTKGVKPYNKHKDGETYTLPVLALRDMVCFPEMVAPLFVGRAQSVAAIDAAMQKNRKVFIVTEKGQSASEILCSNLYSIGTVATIIQKIKLPNSTLKVLVDVECRAEVVNFNQQIPYIEASVITRNPVQEYITEVKAMSRVISEQVDSYISIKKISIDSLEEIVGTEDISLLVDTVSSHIPILSRQKQEILETIPIFPRCEKLLSILVNESEILAAEKAVQERVKSYINKNQKEYFLNEQIKAIRKELGEADSVHDIADKYEEVLKQRTFPKKVEEKLREEIKRLKATNTMSSEAIRSYIDTVIALPWGKVTENVMPSVDEAIKTLDESHYGLDKVKSIILEYITVQSKRDKPSGGILCLYGAPGVGKTKMAKSIAKATKRVYEKISLGGVRDEAEIRGHRKTYVAAMSGKVIQAIKRAGVDNPVILLDEIDKMASDYRGDPESAMLEVLDPEQNSAFQDHYLEVEYDLSKVLFIATANSLSNMQRPLVDRLEVVHIPSYLDDERLEICKNYIVPRVLQESCVDKSKISISDNVIKCIIKHYTKESGVRELERLVRKIARKLLVRLTVEEELHSVSSKEDIVAIATSLDVAEPSNQISVEKPAEPSNQVVSEEKIEDNATERSKDDEKIQTKIMIDISKDSIHMKEIMKIPIENGIIDVTPENLHLFLGAWVYIEEEIEEKSMIGVTNGLAYTESGGCILLVEAVKIPHGKGEVKVTGKLGDVMKESIQASASYIRSRIIDLGLSDSLIKECDIHVHFPAGAVPKDGPSAGIAICTTLVSLLTQIPVRNTVAMTGEMSLRGKVLPIGGLREKLVAALRGGVKTVFIPKANSKDLEEVPSNIKDNLEIVLCSRIDEVLSNALVRQPFIQQKDDVPSLVPITPHMLSSELMI